VYSTALASAALAAVLLGGIAIWPDWTDWSTATRVWRLLMLIGAAGLAYVATLFASGFRLRDLRGI